MAIGGYALFTKLRELTTHLPLISPQQIKVIPMPVTPRRRRERGYNQCELLVGEIGRLDTDHRFQIISDLLIRTHHASRQTLKNRGERIESAKGIFGLDEEALQKFKISNSEYFNETFIIIDDVITTGSTMNEAMMTLKNAGFKNVFGLSLAH